MPITGLVITFNEEKNIGKCLDSLFQYCEEVIIIDSNSTDKTVEIAKSKGAKVYLQAYLGDGPQRTYGLQYCKNDWIMNLDADEFLDEDALAFIRKKEYENSTIDAYKFRVKNFLGNKLINFSGWYPDSKVRFFNKKTAFPSDHMAHQYIIATNEKSVNVHILHYGWESYKQVIDKKNQYSTWAAQQLFEKGKKVSAFKPILNGTVAFVRCYFFKKGILNGIDGFAFSLIQSFFSFMKYVKLINLHRAIK
ncbi:MULTISPECIES: glycosyltransferase family 2 protein [Myroides]|uniref:Glycosyltransferase n=1 Tax=Myroides albus TaxID=2562892 RepID=A0A6I3LMJ4_9FLAO|nr:MULTISPECIES: glycosyltransferase family 2 protein [Myroides]MTG97215.1 glycosyltransferase [Myroides albus]MVX35212.1 glycosyltransferase [Myroides sp. LoEW2-1]